MSKRKRNKKKKTKDKLKNLSFDVKKTISEISVNKDINAPPKEIIPDLDFEYIIQTNIKYRKIIERLIQMIDFNKFNNDYILDIKKMLRM